MNKIEEIFASKYPGNFEEQNIYDCMKEFGKICFEAGGELVYKSIGDYSGYESYKYKNYEEFLKEIGDD